MRAKLEARVYLRRTKWAYTECKWKLRRAATKYVHWKTRPARFIARNSTYKLNYTTKCESAGVGAKRANFCCWLAIHQRVGQQAGVYSIRLRASILHFNCEALSRESGIYVWAWAVVQSGNALKVLTATCKLRLGLPQIVPPLVRARLPFRFVCVHLLIGQWRTLSLGPVCLRFQMIDPPVNNRTLNLKIWPKMFPVDDFIFQIISTPI